MTRTADEITDWLISYLSKELAIAPEALDVNARLFDLGLSSRKTVILAGDLEDWLGVEVPPDLAWEHPSIAALAAHFAGEGAA
ncbi:MAG: acyl carrier protein [Candidatus Sericytochromatia bacterium]